MNIHLCARCGRTAKDRLRKAKQRKHHCPQCEIRKPLPNRAYCRECWNANQALWRYFRDHLDQPVAFSGKSPSMLSHELWLQDQERRFRNERAQAERKRKQEQAA